MKYIDYEFKNSLVFGSMSDLYQQLGILESISKRKNELYQTAGVLVRPEVLTANGKTLDQMFETWKYNWENYNYDRRTGNPKVKTLKKYKNPHKLSKFEKDLISFNFWLGIAPMRNDDVPDGIIRLSLEWTAEDILII